MSFSKAKLNRFNEKTSDAPSPTRYDPKSGDKGKGGAFSKSERVRSVSQSSNDANSTCGTPFRTPFSAVKKHSCVNHSNDRLNVVGRPISFADHAPAASVDDKENLLDLTGALSESHKVAEELRQQNRSLQEQKKELESRIVALEATKSDLECVISNNQNCDRQVNELTQRLTELEATIDKITKEKDALVEKIARDEDNIAKLEDSKIEYETKIVSLEGTLEQVKLEYKAKVDEVAHLKKTSEKLKVSNDCLSGKIASLETEIRRLENEMSEKEQTIFALEEKASSLTSLLESARVEITQQQLVLNNISTELKDQQESCRIHEATIYALDLQIGEKQKDIEKANKCSQEKISALNAAISNLNMKVEEMSNDQENRLKEVSAELIAAQEDKQAAVQERDALIEDLNSKINELEKSHSSVVADLNEKTDILLAEVKALVAEKERLVKAHEEEMFHMQNDWEKKQVQQVQEAENALLEKEAVMHQAEADQARAMREMREELEALLRDAEAEANRRQSAQLEAGEMAKAKYEARIHDLEVSVAEVLECKARELAHAQEEYNEVSTELSAQIQMLEAKNNELADLTSCKHKLSSRISQMLEEIKLLNSENAEKSKAVAEMTGKFTEQLVKNDKLSEQLGELDCKISTLSDELKSRNGDYEKLNSELTHVKDECNSMKVKNMHLQLSVTSHENRANAFSAELEKGRASFKAQLVELNAELSNVKGQCYKFEIALANTRNSLEELGKRLIESECEIDRLTQENEVIRSQLASTENEKNDIGTSYRLAMEIKIELEQRLKDAEESEKILRDTIKELELKTCDFELTKNELKILQSTLEDDKRNYEETLATLQKAVTETNLQMIESERNWLDQVEAVSETFYGKLVSLQKASAAAIQKLNVKVAELEKEKQELITEYQAKRDEFEALTTDHDILKTTFDIVTKESQSVKKHSEDQQMELQKISAKCNELGVEKNELVEKLEAANKTSQELEAEIADKICEKEALKKLNLEQANILSDLESKIKSKNDQIECLTTTLDRTRQEFDCKFADLKSAKNTEIEQLQKELKEYKTRQLTNTDEIISLLANLESQSKKVAELEDRNQTAALRINALVSDLEDEKQAKINAEKEIARLTQLKESSDEEHSVEVERLCAELRVSKEGTEWKRKWQELLEEKEAMAAELLNMTEKKDQYKFHCQEQEKKANAANRDYLTAMKDFEELELVLQDKQAEINKLQTRVMEFESLIGPFREQLEMYETERRALENDRDQLKKQHLEQAAKLGHQNHKQKIQHVVRLKEDILQLRHENQKLQCELKLKNKTIENLREELGEHPKRLFVNGKRPTSTPFKGKENTEQLSPLPTRVKQEAMSPSNALRARNQ